jgi:3-hydroxyisobutyrate dehydrogenase/2-hydroxy-3-oxopropionate reductase
MGSRIAARLLEADHRVRVWDRTREKLAPLLARGAVEATSPADAAAHAEALVTSLADPKALRDVSADIARGAHPSLLVVEMSTVGPAAIAQLRAALPEETALVDAPVLGSLAEVEAGALTIFLGGPTDAVSRAEELLPPLGTVVRTGGLGSGAAAKLVANAALFTAVAAFGETVALGRGLGLADDVVFKALAASPLAGQVERRRRTIEEGTYEPRFRLALALKDAELIREEPSGAGLRLVEATRSWLVEADAAGLGARDYTAMLGVILGRHR